MEHIITPNYVDLRTKYARQNLGLTNEKVHPKKVLDNGEPVVFITYEVYPNRVTV